MKPYSYVPSFVFYFHAKNKKLFMTGFRVSKKLYFWQLIPGFPDTYFPLTYQSTTSCKISEKTNEQSPTYLANEPWTNQQATERQQTRANTNDLLGSKISKIHKVINIEKFDSFYNWLQINPRLWNNIKISKSYWLN